MSLLNTPFAAFTVNVVSSKVVSLSGFAIGASLIGLTVISKVLVAFGVPVPSVILHLLDLYLDLLPEKMQIVAQPL